MSMPLLIKARLSPTPLPPLLCPRAALAPRQPASPYLTCPRYKPRRAHKYLKPTLALVDPTNTHTLCRWTSLFQASTYSATQQRALRRGHTIDAPEFIPAMRPAYQGSGPISDVFALEAFKLMANLPLINEDLGNADARAGLALASTMAGNAFGNAGVHLCHGISYLLRRQRLAFRMASCWVLRQRRQASHTPWFVRGAACPAVFEATSNPEKHLILASILSGRDVNVATATRRAIFADIQFFDTLGVPQDSRAWGSPPMMSTR